MTDPPLDLGALALLDEARARDPWQRPEVVLEWLGLKGDESIVDLGAGTGYFSYHLARALPRGEVIAVEPDEGLRRLITAQARQHHLPISVRAEPPRTAERVFACNLLRHLHLSEGPTCPRWVVVDFAPDRVVEGGDTPPRRQCFEVREVEAQLPLHRRVRTEWLPRQYYLELELR